MNAGKDIQLLRKIIAYCKDTAALQLMADNSEEKFLQDSILQAAAGMFILQIGELAKHLSSELTEKYTAVPWKQIKGMRDVYAHQYSIVNNEKVWETIREDIPILQEHCQKILDEYSGRQH